MSALRVRFFLCYLFPNIPFGNVIVLGSAHRAHSARSVATRTAASLSMRSRWRYGMARKAGNFAARSVH
jgi:hypothetical protein